MIEPRRLAPPMLGASVLNALGGGMIALLLPIEGLAASGLFGGFALPGMVSAGSAAVPVLGAALVARVGHKPIMIGGLLLASLAAASLGLIESTLLRAVAAGAYGVGQGLFVLARLTYLSDAVDPSQRGRIVSSVGGMGRVGMLIGPAIGGALTTLLPASAALGCVGAMPACAALVLTALPHCATVPAESSGGSALGFVGRVLRAHRDAFVKLGGAMLALSFVRSARMLLIPICGTMLGLDPSAVGLAKSASMAADVTLFYPAGLVMDRRGRKWTAVPCLVLLSLGVLVVGLADSTAVFLCGAILAGIGNGLGAGINMTLAGDVSPREGRAEFIGVWVLMTQIGGVSSPFLMGLIATWLALGPAAGVVVSIGVSAGLAVAALVPEPLRARQTEAR